MTSFTLKIGQENAKISENDLGNLKIGKLLLPQQLQIFRSYL